MAVGQAHTPHSRPGPLAGKGLIPHGAPPVPERLRPWQAVPHGPARGAKGRRTDKERQSMKTNGLIPAPASTAASAGARA